MQYRNGRPTGLNASSGSGSFNQSLHNLQQHTADSLQQQEHQQLRVCASMALDVADAKLSSTLVAINHAADVLQCHGYNLAAEQACVRAEQLIAESMSDLMLAQHLTGQLKRAAAPGAVAVGYPAGWRRQQAPTMPPAGFDGGDSGEEVTSSWRPFA